MPIPRGRTGQRHRFPHCRRARWHGNQGPRDPYSGKRHCPRSAECGSIRAVFRKSIRPWSRRTRRRRSRKSLSACSRTTRRSSLPSVNTICKAGKFGEALKYFQKSFMLEPSAEAAEGMTQAAWETKQYRYRPRRGGIGAPLRLVARQSAADTRPHLSRPRRTTRAPASCSKKS